VGSKAYSTTALESGWIPSPLPAVYSGDRMRAYRKWLPATWYEATASLGGSFYSDDIADYYLTPEDLGYGSIVKLDHDFIGRDALAKRSRETPAPRRKVTLAWNGDDVARVHRSIVDDSGDAYKYIEMPLSNYATLPYDSVLVNGRQIGISTFSGCSSNERSMLSLAILDAEHAEPGTEVTLVWGERDGGSSKPTVEPHVQTEIRATVGPVPYSSVARTAYRPS
jgi:glycine cleavage system aminomethyltransferase T